MRVIGTRHGEKVYETLCSREEMMVARDEGNYFRIPSDNRDLNYNAYFDQGSEELSVVEDYNSHNTLRLNVGQMKEMLLSLKFIREQVSGKGVQPDV